MRKSRGVTTYSGAHANVTLHRGRATEYECLCGAQAKEWALRHGAPGIRPNSGGQEFSTEPNDYAPMCFRCHRLYDKARITHCPQGHPYSGDNLIYDAGKRKCKTCVYARNRARRVSPEQKARKIELQRTRRRARMAP